MRPILSDTIALRNYLFATMAFENTEQLRLFYLSGTNVIIQEEVENRGTVETVEMHPREIIARALEVGASRILVVHNHPSGDPRPSAADVGRTNCLIDASRPLGIHVVDHLIVGRMGVTSLRDIGAVR